MSKKNMNKENSPVISKDKPQYKKPTYENYKKHMKNRGGTEASTIQSVMVKTFGKLNIDQRIKQYQIVKHWELTVGPLISQKTEPAKLMGKKLFVLVSTPSWVTELLYQKEEIMNKLNKELGEVVIEDIVFRQGTLSESSDNEIDENKIVISDRELTSDEDKKIAVDTESIKDEELKKIITRTMKKSLKVID